MIKQLSVVILLSLTAVLSQAQEQRCVAIAPEHVREWQNNVAMFAQAMSLVPEVDADTGLIAAWRVDAINTHQLGIDLGLRLGDRVLAIDDVPVHETDNFMARLSDMADYGFYTMDVQNASGAYVSIAIAVADGADCSP